MKQAENGSVSSSRERASEDDTVTLTVSAAQGYRLDELTVTSNSTGKQLSLGAQGGGKYTFKMPASSVTVEASFAEGVELPFTDVDEGAWYYDAVVFAVTGGLMNGTSSDTFSPDLTTTRGMIVTMLHRLAGEPAASGTPFDDVSSGAYYANAVAWAAQHGIVEGYGDGTFGPEDPITREQFAAILYRYAAYKGYDVSVSDDAGISQYDDASEVSDYALKAMEWACDAGVITGRTHALLSPDALATRAESAQMFMNFCQGFVK